MFFNIFKKKPEPVFFTFGGQCIMNLLDDDEVKLVIDREPELATKVKNNILQELKVSEADAEAIVTMDHDPKSSTWTGTIRGRYICVTLVRGGYAVIIDGIAITENLVEKKKITDLIFETKSAVEDSSNSVLDIEEAVRQARQRKENADAEKATKKTQDDVTQAFLRNFT